MDETKPLGFNSTVTDRSAAITPKSNLVIDSSPNNVPDSRNNQLNQLFQFIPERINLEAIDKRSRKKFIEILKQSKTFHRLIAYGGPVALSQAFMLVNTFKHEDFDRQGFKQMEEPIPFGGTHRFYIYNDMLAPEIATLVNNSQTEDFVRDFIDGKYPRNLVFKPDQASYGDGQIRLIREQDKVLIKIIDLKGDGLLDAMRSSNAIRIANSLLNKSDEEKTSDDGTQSFEINLTDRERSIEIISNIINSTLNTQPFSDKKTIYGPDSKKAHLIDSGLVEEELNLLKINNHLVEGRYFVAYGSNGIGLSFGHRHSPTGSITSPSFMKNGKGSTVVNRGDGNGQAWPDMHDELICSNRLNIDKEEFNVYMKDLVLREAEYIYKNLAAQGITGLPLSIDIAWDAEERIKIQTPKGEIEVPKPILMEWNPLINNTL